MNNQWIRTIVIGALGLSACARTPDAESVTGHDLVAGEMEDQSIVHTPLGEFEIVYSRIVNEVKDYAADPQEKILLVVLAELGGKTLGSDTFSLEVFEAMMHD
jgi:hypothetical protein